MRQTVFVLLVLGAFLITSDNSLATDVAAGLGSYSTTVREGGERLPPKDIYRTTNISGPVQSNQWYSSLLFSRWSQPLYALPLSYRATAEGFELGLPEKQILENDLREENDIGYPHTAALTVAPLAFAMQDARADKISDWSLDIVLGNGQDGLKATITHGSPFSYYQVSRGDIKISTAEQPRIYYRSPDGRILALTIHNRAYAIFAPTGAHWQELSNQELVLQFPANAHYFSIAGLPDNKPETAQFFSKYAYAFIKDTHVAWNYDDSKSTVTTTFNVTTEVKEGQDHGTLIGLYPHQWFNNASLRAILPLEYETVRGKVRLISAKQFQTSSKFHGILPHWPGLTTQAQSQKLHKFLDDDLRSGPQAVLGRPGTYWEGKGLGRAVQLMAIAEQQGDREHAAILLRALKQRMESWLRPDAGSNKYFYYDHDIGTLIGYPDEFGSASELNDHHFHYGYWIFAAAQIALRDPEWANAQHWGPMIDMLVGDIANTNRNHAMFPLLRHFDVYEGHSWASGLANFFDGNNLESTSEAINAWAGLILWGEATGNTAMRDTGIYLYTSEINAANHYWFNLYGQVFAPEYSNADVGIVWGGKYVHATWWTDDPREIHGINMLPLTTASMYLGRDPNYVKRNIDTMNKEFEKYLLTDRKQHASPHIWQDILWQYYALYDANEAMAQWDEKGEVEQGETSSHTYHWLQSLVNMGQPHFGITADTSLYSVFAGKDGHITYLAYNAGDAPKIVHFSDGTQLSTPAHRLAQITRKTQP